MAKWTPPKKPSLEGTEMGELVSKLEQLQGLLEKQLTNDQRGLERVVSELKKYEAQVGTRREVKENG